MKDFQDLLASIPIFSFLGRAETAAVEQLFVESTHQKGDIICRQGDEGSTFHVILDGELDVLAGERVVSILKRGDFFGEMALLQGGKRTASVIANRRVKLMTLDRTSFNGLFMKNPKALEYFTRVLCRRLASTSSGETTRGSSMVITVGSRNHSLKGKTLVASALAGVLHDLTKANVIIVRVRASEHAPAGDILELLSNSQWSDELASRLIRTDSEGVSLVEVTGRRGLDTSVYEEKASNVVSKLSQKFQFIVFDLGMDPQGLMDAVPTFSDVFVEIVDQAGLPHNGLPEGAKIKRFRLVNIYNRGSYGTSISSCEPFVLPRDGALTHTESATTYLRTNKGTDAALPIQRLARKILGASVGVALGGGAAFGIAHLGVLKVLEANGIPIDLVAGCSQGSIIGVGYAAGIGVEPMIEMAMSLGKRENSLLAVDLTLTKPGLLAGNRFINIFAPLLGEKNTFEDLSIPCRTVATDIESGERVSIGHGRLTTAFRASASVPMVFAPVRIGKSVLVDGGVADPVPAEVVNEMGADMCIAVNVVPPLKRGIENAVSKTVRQLNRFNPLSYIGDSDGMPNMFDVIMNAMQILQYELGNFKAASADVLINPDLSDFTWVEYYRSQELIERGVEAAQAAMPSINRAIKEKLGPWMKRT